MVRIAHISDSHLGSSMFQLIERREDARACLKKAVDMALRHSPDILVHTGDLFDSPEPHPDDINHVLKIFKDIEDTKVIVLHGNHDIPYGYKYHHSPIRYLETVEFVMTTGDNPSSVHQYDIDGKQVDIHLISWTRKKQFQKILGDMEPESDIAVLFAHDIPVEIDELPIHYDYIGHGHSHNFKLDEDMAIGCPGSTHIIDWKRELGKKRKLIVADIDKNGTEFTTETLNDIREFKFHPGLDITGLDAQSANIKMKDWLKNLSPKKKDPPIVIVRVNGMIFAETEKGIERNSLIEFGEKHLNPLFLHIEPNWNVVGPPELDLSRPLDVKRSLEEYMEFKKDPKKELVIEELQKILGE